MLAALLLPWSIAHADIAISDGGQASYGQALAVPPGIAGMEPKLSLTYVEGGINGPQGVGWSVQGMVFRGVGSIEMDTPPQLTRRVIGCQDQP